MLSTLPSLDAALASGARDATWLVERANWFELRAAAERCAAAGASLRFAVRDAGGLVPCAELALADFAGMYATIREWWPHLGGEGRPSSLAADAHAELVRELRQEVAAAAERHLAPGAAPARLGFPPLEHPLLAGAADALAFWRAFLVESGTDSVRAAALDFAGRADVLELLPARPWLRVLLQRCLMWRWEPRLQEVLAATYADLAARHDLLAAEHAALQACGLEWLATQLADDLGLLQSLRRSRPFRLPKATPGTAAARAAARVTVLIPSYQHEAYVAEAIESVLAQSLDEVRVLVVDDGSRDATVARARAIPDARLEVRSNERNLGLGNSVLAALATIDTPYVALLNSDDLYHPQRLEKCLSVLDEDERCALVSTGTTLVDRDGHRLTPRNVSALFDSRNVRDWVRWYDRTRPKAARQKDLFGELLERNFLATSSNLVCRTEWLRAHGEALRSLKYCLDWQLFLDAAREDRLAWLPEELVAYRLHPSNTVWFGAEARWAYSLEVNRVAAQAIRTYVDALPAGSEARVERALRLIAGHLRANSEFDWTGLYVNELLGGLVLERHSRSSPEIAALVASLEREAQTGGEDAGGAERRRVQSLATQLMLTRDEVYALQGSDAWQRGRIEADDARLREQAEALAEAQRHLGARAAALEEAVAELARTREEARRSEAERAAIAAELAAAAAALRQAEAERDRLRQDLAAGAAALAQRDRQLAEAQAWHRKTEADHAAMAWHLTDALARQRHAAAAMERHSLRLRGLRILPGHGTAKLLRRLRKARRKFGSALGGLWPRLRWWTARPAVVAAGLGPELQAEVRGFAGEAAAELVCLEVHDGNALAPEAKAVPRRLRVWSFPERQRRDWRFFQRRAAAACAGLLQDLQHGLGLDAAGAFAVLGPHLAFARAARRQRAALLWAGETPAGLGAAAVAARLLGRPWAACVAALPPGADDAARWLRRELAAAALLVARSQELAVALRALGVEPSRIVVRPAPPAVVDTPGSGEGQPLHLLALGRLAAGAGWEELVAAAGHWRDRGGRFRLCLAADVDPDDLGALACEARVRAMCHGLGLDCWLEFHPELGAARRRMVLGARPALFAAPWRAPAGPAAVDPGVLAAMANGLPIVASDAPSVVALVRDEEQALVVPQGDVFALMSALARLSVAPDLQQRLGAAARARYAAEFAPAVTRAELGEKVRALLRG